MKIIVKDNKVKYNYVERDQSEGERLSILLYKVAIVLIVFCLLMAIVFRGDTPMILSGVAIASFICNLGSMAFSISEIYLYEVYTSLTRNMLGLQILYILFWIFII